MDVNDKKTVAVQVCTIRIMFPVETDEQAIAYKKRISDALADIPQVRIEFSLMSRPAIIPNGS